MSQSSAAWLFDRGAALLGPCQLEPLRYFVEASRAHNNRTASYLIGTPMLADYLEEALTQFGKSFEDFEEHL